MVLKCMYDLNFLEADQKSDFYNVKRLLDAIQRLRSFVTRVMTKYIVVKGVTLLRNGHKGFEFGRFTSKSQSIYTSFNKSYKSLTYKILVEWVKRFATHVFIPIRRCSNHDAISECMRL